MILPFCTIRSNFQRRNLVHLTCHRHHLRSKKVPEQGVEHGSHSSCKRRFAFFTMPRYSRTKTLSKRVKIDVRRIPKSILYLHCHNCMFLLARSVFFEKNTDFYRKMLAQQRAGVVFRQLFSSQSDASFFRKSKKICSHKE